jgi:peroxiredoxin
VLQYTGGDAASPVLPPEHEDSATPGATINPDEAVKALPQVGAYAPDFTLRTLDGVTLTLSQLRGRAVLVNFWTSWCVACSAEAAELQALYETRKGRNFIILGINMTQQDTVADARSYVKMHQLGFPIPLDEQGTVASAYHVPGLPASFFIDSEGIIRNTILGQMRPSDMRDGLRQIGIQ